MKGELHSRTIKQSRFNYIQETLRISKMDYTSDKYKTIISKLHTKYLNQTTKTKQYN